MNIETDPQEIDKYFENMLGEIDLKYLKKQNILKNRIWKLTIIFSLLFLFLTYSSQFLISFTVSNELI